MRTILAQKLSSTLPMIRRLGIAYLLVSAAMFLFGFTSTLIYQLS